LTLVPAPDFPGSKSKEGVAVSQVDPNSNAADQGLKRGDIIIEVQSKAVSTPDDVARTIREARDKGRKNVLVRLRSRDQERFLALPIEGNSTTALPAR
jgi:serine protease Do